MQSNTSSLLELRFLQFILFGLLFLSFMHYGGISADHALDPSWLQGLGMAYKQNMQFGIDIIFTYGPLGYFYNATTPYDADLFVLFMTWQIMSALIIALLFMLHGQQLNGLINKWIYFFLVFMLSAQSVHLVDSVYYLSILVIMALVVNPPAFVQKQPAAVNWLMMLLILSLFAILAMTKFVLFLIIGFNVVIMTIIIGWQQSWLKAILIPPTYAGLVIGLWVLLGQDIAHLPAFFFNSLEISKGYNAAMLTIGASNEILPAVGLMGIAALVGLMSAFVPKFSLVRFLLTCSIGFSSFLVFKAGFVRHDAPHASIFYGFLMMIGFLFSYETKMYLGIATIFHGLRYILITMSFIGLVWTNQFFTINDMLGYWNTTVISNAKQLVQLPILQQNYDKHLKLRQQIWDLPQVRKIVGNETVDLVSFEQGTLFLNQFNWHPRPIYQGYSAYTSRLLIANGDFYASEQAPRFVLFKLQTIDGRFPLIDDIEVIKVLMRDYVIVLQEKGYLLLQREPRGQGRVTEGEIVLQQPVDIGQAIEISEFNQQPLLLTLDFEKTMAGELFSFLYKSSLVYMELTTDTGVVLRYRIMPKMMETGVLINPLLINQVQFIDWHEGKALQPIQQVKIIVENTAGVSLFDKEIDFKLSVFPVLPRVDAQQ